MRRRLALPLLPAILAACGATLLAACGSTPVPVVEGPPIAYGHLTQLRVDAASIELDPFTPNAGPNDVGRELRPNAADAVRVMARDRLAAFGTENVARFQVVRAQILRTRNAPRGGFLAADAGERLEARLAARLEIRDATGRRLGFAEAETTRSRGAVDSTDAARRAAAESLLRQAMFDLNTEFEFQLRRSLRPYLQDGPAGATPPTPVEREALPPA